MKARAIRQWAGRILLVGGFVFLTVIAVAQIIRAYQNPVSFSPYVAYIATIAFILLLVGSYCFYRSEVHIAADLLKDIKIVIPLGAVFALAVLSVSVARPKMSDIEVFSSPGVIFVVAMAILTVLGFFLTVSKLHEMQSRILGYDVLMERCTELVRAEVSRVANENKPGKLIVFANAPGFGNMSAPDQFDRYRQELHKLIDLSTARVVLGCLSWEGGSESRHDNFYSEHWGNREDFGARVAESRNIAEKVVERYDPVSDNKMAYALVNEIQEVPFHLVLTSERAILFVSLNYPRRNNAAGGSSDTAHVPTPQKPARIIAWETNDTAVREALEEGVMARLTNPAYARRVLPPGKAPAAAVNTP